MEKSYLTVDAYIADFPKDIQKILEKIRQTIKEAAPQALEEIAYQMPAYKLNKKPLLKNGMKKQNRLVLCHANWTFGI